MRYELKTTYTTFDVSDTGRIVCQDDKHSFWDLACAVYQRVIYRDIDTGYVWIVEAVAWEESPTMIRKVLMINGEVHHGTYRSKHPSDNALFNMVSSTEKAVLYTMSHAESLIKNMAFNAKQEFSAEYNA